MAECNRAMSPLSSQKPLPEVRRAVSMLAPFSELFYASPVNKGNVSWSTINDLGGFDAHSQKL